MSIAGRENKKSEMDQWGGGGGGGGVSGGSLDAVKIKKEKSNDVKGVKSMDKKKKKYE